MASADEGCSDPVRELRQGFDPADYPGVGLFVAAHRPIAESFQNCYQHGMQEFFMLQVEFDRLVQQHVIEPDPYYPVGQSWYVRPAGLAEFNTAMKQASAGHYLPQP